MREHISLIHAAGAVDGSGTVLVPCSALISASDDLFPAVNLLAIGDREAVQAHPASAALPSRRIIEAPDSILIPGLVNAHTHLDLTHIGPRPFEIGRSFVDWVDMIRAERTSQTESIRASVSEGARRSLAGGVVAVGDIAGVFGIDAFRALASTHLIGLSGIELFGVGKRQVQVLGMLDGLADEADIIAERSAGLGWTWQPHAPYSVGPRLYRECARRCSDRDIPMMTHLAETPEERQFVASGDGLQRELLERLGAWDSTCGESIGKGASPVSHLRDVLDQTRTIAAHVNCASDADIETLAATRTTVAYCPRASEYFRQHDAFGPHRYRDMLEAGINVALGTDSIVNLPADQAERISTLDDARLLVGRDGLDPTIALGMATWRGGLALGLDREGFSLAPRRLPRRLYGLSLVKIGAEDLSGVPESIAAMLMASEHIPTLVRPSESTHE